jgi:hypothetical protein
VVSAGKPRVGRPKTLWDAHQFLMACRPLSGASPQKWLKYYQDSASLYAEIAEIDRGHHHETLYWAGRERRKAEKLAEMIRSGKPVDLREVNDRPDYM